MVFAGVYAGALMTVEDCMVIDGLKTERAGREEEVMVVGWERGRVV